MLWAEDNNELPNNYFTALVQLKSLEKRLTKDQTLWEKYSTTVKEDLDKGYVVRVKDAHKVERRSKREWYLPHHPAVSPNKPGKVRRVLNEAAKFHGASLNKSLLTGPDFMYSYGSDNIDSLYPPTSREFSSELKGYHGISHHCTFCGGRTPDQVLWYTSIHATSLGQKIRPSAPTTLRRTASDNAMEYLEAAKAVLENFYMDDYLRLSGIPREGPH